MAHRPLERLRRWYQEAVRAGERRPDALALATADDRARPSVRIVLLKRITAEGIVFYTDGSSRKGRELSVNPRAAASLYWPALARQVRLEGPVRPVSAEASDAYWRSRPRGSRISASVSSQSATIASRAELSARRRALERKLVGGDVPRPQRWGGYLLRVEAIEFWSEKPGRFHHRELFERRRDGWNRRILQP
jgi:pyridoxamine 5'-phosphate oxidase